GIHLGFQPSAAVSHRRRGEIEQHEFLLRFRDRERAVEVGLPRDLANIGCHETPPACSALLADSVPLRASVRGALPLLTEHREEEEIMLSTLAVILLVMWLLGLVSGYTLGNFIYVLLVIAVVLFLVDVIGGRRTVLLLARAGGVVRGGDPPSMP